VVERAPVGALLGALVMFRTVGAMVTLAGGAGSISPGDSGQYSVRASSSFL
jgi:hypothetical protein